MGSLGISLNGQLRPSLPTRSPSWVEAEVETPLVKVGHAVPGIEAPIHIICWPWSFHLQRLLTSVPTITILDHHSSPEQSSGLRIGRLLPTVTSSRYLHIAAEEKQVNSVVMTFSAPVKTMRELPLLEIDFLVFLHTLTLYRPCLIHCCIPSAL